MKVKGSELQAFYDDWIVGEDWYHDEGTLHDCDEDGHLIVDSMETYDLEDALGFLAWQGHGEEPRYITVKGRKITVNDNLMVNVFKAWKGTDLFLTVVVPPAQRSLLEAFALKHNWKIIG